MYYVAWRLFVFRLLAEILKLDLKHVNSVTNYKKYFHYLVDVIEKPVLTAEVIYFWTPPLLFNQVQNWQTPLNLHTNFFTFLAPILLV